MKNLLIIIALLLSIQFENKAQTEIGGVNIPNTLKAGNQELILNGGGIREKYFLDMYVGGLYLTAKQNNPDKIIMADEAMAIKMHIVSGLITSEKMEAAVDEGFEKATNGNVAPLEAKIKKFKEIFREEIQEDDIYDLIYVPGKGVEVYKNGQKASTIPGLKFKQALFGIWLCDEPADEDLKEGMLGND